MQKLNELNESISDVICMNEECEYNYFLKCNKRNGICADIKEL
jgi:hypothetical protein